jgi:serine/threonine protein phosphatase PrpC
MKFALAHDSRKGGRPYNQDRLGTDRTGEALLMAVADGMGGYAGGELAAQAAIDSVSTAFRAQARPRLADPEAFLARAISDAHLAIVQRGIKAGLGEAPRTTLVACVVQAGYAYWSFIGDSRLYLIREGRVAARTRDHSMIQQLVDAGRVREEAVAAHPERNKLLRCLGGQTLPRPEAPASARLARGDIVLLCSDGLWGPLTPRRLLTEFIGVNPARALPRAMAIAEAHGGQDCDNLSAVAMQWQEEAVLDLVVC